MNEGQEVTYGGQAVIEGVMMRGPTRMSIALRKADGTISIHERSAEGWAARYGLRRIPFVRGVVALVESMVTGIDALLLSAKEAAAEEGEKIGTGETVLTLGVAVVFAVGVFMVLPTIVADVVRRAASSSVLLNLVEGAFRLVIFLGYLFAISLLKDVRRVFQYHGAEHKVINALEAGEELSVPSIRRYPTAHPRCGTSFLLIVVLVSILVFGLFGWPSHFVRTLVRLAMLPVIAGVSYELMKLAARRKGFVSVFAMPGLWVQKLTALEPDDSQIEVAVAAIKSLLEEQKGGSVRECGTD